MVASDGKVYTWGNGEFGALGHGNKQSVTSPKAITSLNGLVALQISCGPYHTAIIADPPDQVLYIRLPSTVALGNSDSKSISQFADMYSDARNISCGTLYTCGMGKAGQLGHGENVLSLNRPVEVSFMSDNGYKVTKVSCGMHHTLMIATPLHSIRVFMTYLLSCGWGEHGRLGLGDEEGRFLPTLVSFTEPFHPIDISAGEQHSIATSCKPGMCYTWGSNSFGQCAVSSSTTECCLLPSKIPLPEGITVTKVAAGGRHTAAISACGKVLSWGWGEEGQLGQGNEKNNWLPKPIKIPTVNSTSPYPTAISLGFCHTVIVGKNCNYVPPQEKEKKPEKTVEIPMEPIHTVIEEEMVKILEPEVVKSVEIEPVVIHPIIVVEETKNIVQAEVAKVVVMPELDLQHQDIRSIKDILKNRDARR